jgi:hypothetical protein
MVDPTNIVGGPRNIGATERPQPLENNVRRERADAQERGRSEPPRDEVRISEEALSLSQAENAAREAREALERDQSQSLGLDPNFDRTV